jgi:hypothetical protein
MAECPKGPIRMPYSLTSSSDEEYVVRLQDEPPYCHSLSMTASNPRAIAAPLRSFFTPRLAMTGCGVGLWGPRL